VGERTKSVLELMSQKVLEETNILGSNGQAHTVARMDLVHAPARSNRHLSACRYVFDLNNDGFVCSNTMEISDHLLSLCNEHSSSKLTSTHEWERWNQTTLLRGYRGGLLPCQRSSAVCGSLSHMRSE
jgi:hypothetical protein